MDRNAAKFVVVIIADFAALQKLFSSTHEDFLDPPLSYQLLVEVIFESCFVRHLLHPLPEQFYLLQE